MIYSLSHRDRYYLATKKKLSTPNNVIVAITTNGMATDVVEMIISKIRGYGLGNEIFVVKEGYDEFHYSCTDITVPIDYISKNRSKNKLRALQYANEWFHEKGYGKETYICHLDDDSLVDRDYLEYIANYMTGDGGQGCIRLRAFGRHLFSSLSDIGRISNCEAWCKRYNKKNRPQFVHGEGLVVRADIEWKIGWDYATYGAEDLIMGLSISKEGTFEYIASGNIYIAPPTTTKDYYKQRRRWFWSIFKNDGRVRSLNLKTFAFYMYMYVAGVIGLISLVMFPILLISQDHVDSTLILLSIINIVCFFTYYQFGAMEHGSKKVSIVLLTLQIPIAFYDGFTIFYSLVTRPNFQVFETIKKV